MGSLKFAPFFAFVALFFTTQSTAADYIFTYKSIVKDGVSVGEKYHFAPIMVQNARLKTDRSCEIEHDAPNEKAFLKNNKEQILECFFGFGVRLRDNASASNLKARSYSTLEIPPSRVRVEFARGIATIYSLKEGR